MTLQGPRSSRRGLHTFSCHTLCFSHFGLSARLQACCILLPALGFVSFPPRVPTRCCASLRCGLLRFPDYAGPPPSFPSSAAEVRPGLPGLPAVASLLACPARKAVPGREPRLQGVAPPESFCAAALPPTAQSIPHGFVSPKAFPTPRSHPLFRRRVVSFDPTRKVSADCRSAAPLRSLAIPR